MGQPRSFLRPQPPLKEWRKEMVEVRKETGNMKGKVRRKAEQWEDELGPKALLPLSSAARDTEEQVSV